MQKVRNNGFDSTEATEKDFLEALLTESSQETPLTESSLLADEEIEEVNKEVAKNPKATNGTPYKASRKDIFFVKFTQLRLLPDFNIREDYGDIEELANSIRQNGVLQDVIGFREKDEDGSEVYIVVHGHRRHAACKLIYEQDKIDIEVPFKIEGKNLNMEDRLVQTFITNEGKPMSDMEQAEGVRRLMNYGWTVANIAERLGKSESKIRNLEKLAAAPMALKNLIRSKAIAPAAALDAINNNVVDKVIEMYKERTDEQFSPESNAFDPATALALNTGDSEAPVDLTYKKAEKKRSGKITSQDVAAAAGKVNSLKELKAYLEDADTEDFNEAQIEIYKMFDRLIANDLSVRKFQNFMKKMSDYKYAPPKK